MRYQRSTWIVPGEERSGKKKVDPMHSDSHKILTNMSHIHVSTLKANVHALLLLNQVASAIHENQH